MNSSIGAPRYGFVDTAKPLPFQMRNARWAEGEGEGGGGGKPKEGQSFTQEDVDRIVADRLKRERDKITAQYADYDDLRAKAEGAKTAEDRIAELERKYQDAETARLRSDVAAKHGISAEDRDLFLTGTDQETLTKQAERLAGKASERKKNSNLAPREGTNPQPAADEMRDFTRKLFGRQD